MGKLNAKKVWFKGFNHAELALTFGSLYRMAVLSQSIPLISVLKIVAVSDRLGHYNMSDLGVLEVR